MDFDRYEVLFSLPPEVYTLLLALSLLRPLGILYGFTIFSWGISHGLMLRLTAIFPLSLFFVSHEVDEVVLLASSTSVSSSVGILAVEFFLGFALGALSSSGFHALKYAGAITDSYRGENNAGIQDPSGGELNTFSLIYFSMGAYLFCTNGGFLLLVDSLAETYVVWPIGSQDIRFSRTAWQISSTMVTRSLTLAMVIAAPLLIVLLVVDFSLAIASKIGQRLHVYEYSFVLKNLSSLLALPFMVLVISRVSLENLNYLYTSVIGIERFLK